MTTNSKVVMLTDSASWFRRKVAQLGAALQPAAQPLEALVHHVDARERRPVERLNSSGT